MKTPSVPALERGLAVLELLANSRAGLTLAEIARTLDLPKSSVHCLLVTLERRRYLYSNDRTKRYVFGSKLFAIGNRSLSGLQVRQVAVPHMHVLTQRTGLTTHLAILEQNEAVLVEKVEPPGVFKLATWLGKRMDLHCTSLGKALISELCEDELDRLVRETGLPRHNDNSIASMRKLRAELARARQVGYSIDDEEDEIGYRCVGAPVYDKGGHVAAAVSISGTILQVREDNSEALTKHVVKAAETITHSFAEYNSNAGRKLDIES